MKEILLAYKKLNGNASAQAYTFAIRTSRHTDPKLQKSMLLAYARIENKIEIVILQNELKDKKYIWRIIIIMGNKNQ